MKRALLLALLPALLPALLLAPAAPAQYTRYSRKQVAAAAPAPTITSTTWPGSNAAASNGWAPTRKQLGNVGTGCSGGTITPSGDPVGQLYATTAIKTAAVAAGCANQGVVAVTATGTGIAPMDNGHSAGGVDSPLTVTDTYGGAATDTFCTGDTKYAALVGTVVVDIPMPGCKTNSSALVGMSTALTFPFADTLWPTSYQDLTPEPSLYSMIRTWFRVNDVPHTHDVERDHNYVNAAHDYFGWGSHWNATRQMLEACPQACGGWITEKWLPVKGGAAVTTYPLTSGHIYGMAMWYHRDAGCSSASLSPCYWYDYILIWDQTAGATPTLYRIVDTSGAPIGGIPIARPSYPVGLITEQWQLDSVCGSCSPSLDADSDIAQFYTK